mmetsp:Transcript_19433/g.58307  ORF Transcript_19433/g.58307 Transcript_19433/m.58307 type:complete len:243 (-) Transcript_19433:897-1625(-)
MSRPGRSSRWCESCSTRKSWTCTRTSQWTSPATLRSRNSGSRGLRAPWSCSSHWRSRPRSFRSRRRPSASAPRRRSWSRRTPATSASRLGDPRRACTSPRTGAPGVTQMDPRGPAWGDSFSSRVAGKGRDGVGGSHRTPPKQTAAASLAGPPGARRSDGPPGAVGTTRASPGSRLAMEPWRATTRLASPQGPLAPPWSQSPGGTRLAAATLGTTTSGSAAGRAAASAPVWPIQSSARSAPVY